MTVRVVPDFCSDVQHGVRLTGLFAAMHDVSTLPCQIVWWSLLSLLVVMPGAMQRQIKTLPSHRQRWWFGWPQAAVDYRA